MIMLRNHSGDILQTYIFNPFYRWNNLKMKVNQAKQKLVPRIEAQQTEVIKVCSLRFFSYDLLVLWTNFYLYVQVFYCVTNLLTKWS